MTLSRQATLKLLLCLSIFAGYSSSASASPGDASSEDPNGVATKFARPVVFGKFRLLKNGNEVRLGDGFFSNVAALRLYRPEDQEEFTGRVGDDGEFALQLAPGDRVPAGPSLAGCTNPADWMQER